ncbi:hypothetical protein EJB05_54306 [Eragrostis curvula]|uniref:Transposase (putative) gypsy type domain-containing protein n=1 Tax=Eragrostis curvula TaxID=38414 RepID=A0A5J9SMR4_9POAL|nr:hypothetical protein EJB05_54306 [Eragrostis curvula]
MCFSFDTTEIPVFKSHMICGFNLPPSKFLERVCKFYKIELIHLKPVAVSLLSLFSTLCECWLGTAPSLDLWRVYHEPCYYSSGLVGCMSFNRRRNIVYPPFAYRRSWSGYRWKYFLMDDSESYDIKGKGLLPYHQGWIKAAPVRDERLKRMVAKVTELVTNGLRGEHIVEEYVRRCFFPLQHREPLAMFGDGPRNPKWLPSEVDKIPEEEVKRRVYTILESDLQPRPEGFPEPYSATNPATEDMFGPDPFEGGVESTMVLDSSSSEKEPSEAQKKSLAEAFADDILTVPEGQEHDVDHQSLEEKVAAVKATLMSDAPPKPSAPKPSSPPKPRTARKLRSSKPSASGEVIVPQVQPLRPRKRRGRTPLLAPVPPPADSVPEMPAVRGTVDPGKQVPLSIVFGTLFHGFSRISQIRACQGQRKPGAKRLRVLAGGADDVAATSTSAVMMPAENEQLKLKISEAAPSSLLVEKEAKITELEAALTGVNKALADLKTAHASEVKSLQDTNATLATSVDTLKDESQALKEKLELKDKDVQLLQQRVSTLEAEECRLKSEKDDAVEVGYARCISGSAYTIALFQHHIPNLNLSLLDQGFKCDATQRDTLMNQAHAAADAFVTSLNLIPEAAPAEQESAEDDASGDDQE